LKKTERDDIAYSSYKKEVSQMEIHISFSVKISIAEARANINDIVKEIKQVLQETGEYLLKQILKGWEERIVTAFCKGLVTIPHRRKGRRGRDCLGKGDG
jgi:hypothetical protein